MSANQIENFQSYKIPVSIGRANIPRFLDYFAVALSRFKSDGSEAEQLVGGGFKENYRCLLPVEKGLEVLSIWTIDLTHDGALSPIEVSVPADVSDGWQLIAETIVRETLIDMVNGRKSKFFQRHLFAYMGHPLDGEYYISGFRIAPSQPVSPFPFGISEEVLILDLEAEGINAGHAATLGKVQATKTSSLLSLFLDIGLYPIRHTEARWVREGDGSYRSAQLGYKSDIPMPTRMPAKGQECKAGTSYEVDRLKEEPWVPARTGLQCPKDIRLLFRIFYSLPTLEQSSFLGASSLFQIGVVAGKHYPSLRVAYLAAAVDSLTKDHTMNSFVELFSRLNPESDVDSITHLYRKYRSAHFHAGALPGGELLFVDYSNPILMIQREQLSKNSYLWSVRASTRTVLLRWLLERQPVVDQS